MTQLLEWLGAMIAQPLQPDHNLPPLSPWGTETEQEVERLIAPSPTLKPYQRVQIYHQQYWWRLLKCFQENYPTVSRLFGYDSFHQQLVVPYLTAHPPSHWALCRLGETFPQWLEMHYHAGDRYLVTSTAQIDRAAGQAFWARALPPIDFASLSPEEKLSQHLVLQPHIHLFSLQGDLFTFRDAFLQHPAEYYNTNAFPTVHYGDYHFVLYRTRQNMVTWKQISRAEKTTLSLFQRGNSIQQVCAVLEEQGGDLLEEALSQIPFWFKQWTVLSWFGHS